MFGAMPRYKKYKYIFGCEIFDKLKNRVAY